MYVYESVCVNVSVCMHIKARGCYCVPSTITQHPILEIGRKVDEQEPLSFFLSLWPGLITDWLDCQLATKQVPDLPVSIFYSQDHKNS